MPPPGTHRAFILSELIALLPLIRPPAAHAPDPPLQTLAPFEVFVEGLQAPRYLATDPQNRLFVSESEPGEILQLWADHTVTVLINRLKDPEGIIVDPTGAVFLAADRQRRPEGQRQNGVILRRDPHTHALTVVANDFKEAKGLGLDPEGVLILSARRRRRLTASPQARLSE